MQLNWNLYKVRQTQGFIEGSNYDIVHEAETKRHFTKELVGLLNVKSLIGGNAKAVLLHFTLELKSLRDQRQFDLNE